MAKVLSISSQVVYGHVGNSAALFVMQRMGHEALCAPTILLSNRPGYKAIAGERIDPQKLGAIIEALWANGWLANVDAIVTGYLPGAEHVALCALWVAKIKAACPRAIYLCDPIIGDEPDGVYIDEAAARAVRDRLLPLADIATPNAFELSWLTGRVIADAQSALHVARALGRPAVIVTSAPAGAGLIANILVEGEDAAATAAPRREVRAHGTGDFFASLFLAHRLKGRSAVTALRAASGGMETVLDCSQELSELALIETQDRWAAADPAFAPLFALP